MTAKAKATWYSIRFAVLVAVVCTSVVEHAQAQRAILSVGGEWYEMAKRLDEQLDDFLDITETHLPSPALQLQAMFAAPSNPFLQAGLFQQLLLTQLQGCEFIDAVQVVYTNGHVIGFKRGHGGSHTALLTTTFTSNATDCNTPPTTTTTTTTTTKCLQTFTVDMQGNPINKLSETAVDVLSSIPERFSFSNNTNNNMDANITHTYTYTSPHDDIDAGIAFTVPLTNSSGSVVAFASLFRTFATLDTFLASKFQNISGTGAVAVFVAKPNWQLVAASVAHLEWFAPPTNTTSQFLAFESPNTMIREAARVMSTVENQNLQVNEVHVHNSMYIHSFQVTKFPGIVWNVYIVGTAFAKNIRWDYTSPSFILLVMFASILTAVTLFLLAWVVRYRKLRLWVFSQPRVMILILISYLLCLVYVFTLLVNASHAVCQLRVWGGALGMTLLGAAIVENSLHSQNNANILGTVLTRESIRNLWCVRVVVMLQVALVFFEMVLSPPVFETKFEVIQSNLQIHHECKHNTQMFLLEGIVMFLVQGAALVSCIQTRATFEYGSQRGFLITSVTGTMLILSYHVLLLTGVIDSEETAPAALAVAEMVFVVGGQGLIFWNKLSRQINEGDITLMELRHIITTNANAQSSTTASLKSLANVTVAHSGNSNHASAARLNLSSGLSGFM